MQHALELHRITQRLRLEGTSGDHLVHPACSSRVSRSKLHTTISRGVQGGRLHDLPGYLTVNQCFLIFHFISAVSQLVPIASHPFTVHHLEDWLQPLNTLLLCINKAPLGLLFFVMSSSSSFSLSSCQVFQSIGYLSGSSLDCLQCPCLFCSGEPSSGLSNVAE